MQFSLKQGEFRKACNRVGRITKKKIMRSILFLFLFLITFSLSGQCPEVIWTESFEDYPNCQDNSLFQSGCADNWCASFGLPSLENHGICDGG